MTNGDPRRTRAIVLTTQRTGSTFLVDCLHSHPDIECASEILVGDPDDPRTPQYRGQFKAVAKVGRLFTSGAWRPAHRMTGFFSGGSARVRIFKVMYNHLANPFALGYLRKQEDVRVIHLRRHNLLKVHVSKLLMPKRARVQAIAPVDAVQIHVDPDRAIASMRAATLAQARYDELFAAHPILAVTYEELFDGQYLQSATAGRICDFLGVERVAMKSRIVKLNPESLREMVTNFDELAAAVTKTEFADMLA